MAEKKPFISVDSLIPQVTLEQAAAFYRVELPELKRVGQEIRARCFLNCGRDSGERALAIQADHPGRQWTCHQSGCGKAGNLVSLCDLMKPGEPAGGKPRGERFKAIAADIAAMVAGVLQGTDAAAPVKKIETPPKPEVNVPLAASENPRARELTNLDAKFVRDVAALPPKVSADIRRRPYLTPQTLEHFRVGYLPRDGGEDKSGGTMRGRIVFPYLSEAGELLSWFGRDVEYAERRAEWVKAGSEGQEVEEFRFVKGFHKGLELWGQHRLRDEKAHDSLRQCGLVLVPSPDAVMRLDALGVAAVGLCNNLISRIQAEKSSRLAREHGNGVVTVFMNCDADGLVGMRQCLGYLAQHGPVRLAWTDKMFGGKFKDRTPESLADDEWNEISIYLRTGERMDWTVT